MGWRSGRRRHAHAERLAPKRRLQRLGRKSESRHLIRASPRATVSGSARCLGQANRHSPSRGIGHRQKNFGFPGNPPEICAIMKGKPTSRALSGERLAGRAARFGAAKVQAAPGLVQQSRRLGSTPREGAPSASTQAHCRRLRPATQGPVRDHHLSDFWRCAPANRGACSVSL